MALLVAWTVVLTGLLVVLAFRLKRSLQRFKPTKAYAGGSDVPTVTVCIPARNETHAMAQCLERVLASDYQKLEVIVYDDSSEDDTSILVKSFAHAGVRFVPGAALPEGWLGRNHALEILAREASGDYLLFLDVDTFIGVRSVGQLMGYMLAQKLQMVSVIPGRSDQLRGSVLFGHLRYFWELILSHPTAPASSTALWIIDRDTLLDMIGGFAAYKNDTLAEAHIASRLGTDRYHCLLGMPELSITYEKKWGSQIETSLRLLYPMVGGDILMAALAFVVLVLLNTPVLVFVVGIIFNWGIMQIVSLWVLLTYMALYGVYTSVVWRHGWWLGASLWPVIIFQETVLFGRSVLGYMRDTITWKGRSISAQPYRANSIKIND